MSTTKIDRSFCSRQLTLTVDTKLTLLKSIIHFILNRPPCLKLFIPNTVTKEKNQPLGEKEKQAKRILGFYLGIMSEAGS